MVTTANIYTVISRPVANTIVTNNSGQVVSPAAVISSPIANVSATSVLTRAILGHPIMVYKIPQIVQLTYPASLSFGGTFMSNYPMNRTDFRLVRGVQNEINIYVRDVDRKPVTLGFLETLTINIVDQKTETLLMTRNLTTIDSSQGIYLLTIFPSEMNTWPTSSLQWSVSYNRSDGSTVLLWTDRNYSPYSTTTITVGPVPGPAPTVTLLWTDFSQLVTNTYYSPALTGAAKYGYNNGMQTFVVSMTNFTGTVRIDGSLVSEPTDDANSLEWFQVDLQTYTSNTGNVVLNEQGNFLWMRVVIVPDISNNTGTIDQLQYKF